MRLRLPSISVNSTHTELLGTNCRGEGRAQVIGCHLKIADHASNISQVSEPSLTDVPPVSGELQGGAGSVGSRARLAAWLWDRFKIIFNSPWVEDMMGVAGLAALFWTLFFILPLMETTAK